MKCTRVIGSIVLLLLAALPPPCGALSIWNATTNANWADDSSWIGGAPSPAGEAVFTNTSHTIAFISSDVACGSLSVGSNYAGTIMFQTGAVGSLTVNGDLYLGSNNTILCTYVSTNGYGTGRVVTVAGNATILGKLSATGKGFPEHGYPAGANWGTHGGRGYSAGAPYGSLTNPVELGAGGHVPPADGGGAIQLNVASNLEVYGQIEANGLDANIDGAGGSLWITCYSLSGDGAIRADSGGGSGAGGRVALYYTNSTFTGPISAAGYQAGTLYEPGKFPTGSPGSPATVFIPESGFRYTFPDSTVTNYWDLTISNKNMLAAGKGSVDFYGGRLVITNLDLRGNLRFDFHDVQSGGSVNGLDMSNLVVSGNIMLRQGALLLPAQGTYSNIATLTVSNGATIYCGSDISVTNEDSGGTASPRHGVGVVMYCQNAFISGTLNGDALGWPQGTLGICPLPGAHGGVKYNAPGGDRPYGNLTRPSCPASESPGNWGPGGGAISLFATDTVAISGKVTCAGSTAAGGTIRIAANTLCGTGTLSAVGTDASGTGTGGGRIALECAQSTFSGQIKVDSTGSANPGSKGTIFMCTSPVPGTVTFVSTGIKLNTAFSINGGYYSGGTTNGLQVLRNVAVWQTNPAALHLRWTDSSSTIPGEPVTNVTAYTVFGLPDSADFNVYSDGAFLYLTNSGAAGTIAVTNVNIFPNRTLDIVSASLSDAIPAMIRTDPPTNVTIASACMNGYLTATGDSDTAVFLFWGTADGGTNPGGWFASGEFAAPQNVGALATNVAVAAGYEYFYRFAASNAAGLAWAAAPAEYFVTTGLTVSVAPLYIGELNETGTFHFARPAAFTSMPLTVYYTIGGTATNGVDYQAIVVTSAVIAAGATNADVSAVTIRDAVNEGDETVILTIVPSAYLTGAPDAATLTITNTPVQTYTQIWISAGPANWNNPAAWSGGVPLDCDDAVFTNTGRGVASITADAACRNLVIATNYASTIIFATGYVAGLTVNGDLFLGTNTTLLATYVSIETNNCGTGRVIAVGGDATINGKLSATGQGYPQHIFPIAAGNWASHGGRGYANSASYGSLTNPVELGGGGHVDPCDGGGAIKLTVGSNLTVNGQIEANGRSSNIGGAGGSLWITCYTLAGSGSIRADSGGSGVSPGAGGRVALYYTNSTFTGPISAAGYQAGTLYEPNKFPTGTPGSPATIFIPESGFRYTFPDSTVTNYWNLTVSNTTMLSYNMGYIDFYGGRLVITNLDLRGKLRFDFNDTQNGGSVRFLSMSNLFISGDVTLRQGTLMLPAQATCSNITTLSVSNGFTVYCGTDLSVTNEDSGGNSTNRHGVGVAMYCRDAVINGSISGVGLGWNTFSGGPLAGAYGGVRSGAAAGDRPYGNFTRPSCPGANSAGNHGPGGGAFSLFATNAVTLNGTLNFSGSQAPGGTVRIACSSFGGTGTVSAVGDCDNGVTGQGGGRIALEYVTSTFSGQLKVDSTAPNPGCKGTIFMCTSPVPGAITFAGTDVRLDTDFGINGGYASAGTSNGVQVIRDVTRWQTGNPILLRWTDTSTTATGGPMTNSATYTISGLGPQKTLDMYIDGAPFYRTNSGLSGTITITNLNLFPSRMISIEQNSIRGTVITFY